VLVYIAALLNRVGQDELFDAFLVDYAIEFVPRRESVCCETIDVLSTAALEIPDTGTHFLPSSYDVVKYDDLSSFDIAPDVQILRVVEADITLQIEVLECFLERLDVEAVEGVERCANDDWSIDFFVNEVGHNEVGAVDVDKGALVSEALHFVHLRVHGDDHVTAATFYKFGDVGGKEGVDCALLLRTG